MQIKAGTTDVSIPVKLRDSSNGTAKTGLVYNSAGAKCYYLRGRGLPVQIALATLGSVNAAHSDGGFIEKSAGSMKGSYRLDLPDAAIASGLADGVKFVTVHIEFTGVFAEEFLIELTDNTKKDIYDIVSHGNYGNAQLVRATTPGNTLDIDGSGDVWITQSAADRVWNTATRTLTSLSGLAGDIAAAVWNAMEASYSGSAGSFGEWFKKFRKYILNRKGPKPSDPTRFVVYGDDKTTPEQEFKWKKPDETSFNPTGKDIPSEQEPV